jgi:subtilase family serine protease
VVQVGNTGAGDAEALTVSLYADGAHIDTRTIDGLKAGDFTTVKFTGPRCSKLRAVVDRGQTVPETVEEDNELRARCPASRR